LQERWLHREYELPLLQAKKTPAEPLYNKGPNRGF
jgi:hypothetical protein